jgi:hypothetical protein
MTEENFLMDKSSGEVCGSELQYIGTIFLFISLQSLENTSNCDKSSKQTEDKSLVEFLHAKMRKTLPVRVLRRFFVLSPQHFYFVN